MKTTADGLNYIDEETGLIIPIEPDMASVMGVSPQIETQTPSLGIQGSPSDLNLPIPSKSPVSKPPENPILAPYLTQGPTGFPLNENPTYKPPEKKSDSLLPEGMKNDAMGQEMLKDTPVAIPSGEAGKKVDTLNPMDAINSMPDFINYTETQTSSNTSQNVYGKKDKADYEQSVDNFKQAQSAIKGLMEKVDNDPKINNQISKVASASFDLQDILDPESEKFKTFTSQVTDAKNKIEEAEKDLAEFQKEAKVDPRRYTDNMTNTSKALTMLAVALEGVGSAMAARGGLNLPTGVIGRQLQDAIDSDIMLQKDELASKEKGLTTDVNRYAKNLAMLKDERAAELKTKSDMLMVTKTTLDNMKMKYQGQFDMAEQDKITAGIDMQIAQTTMDLNKRIVNSSIQTSTKPIENPYKKALMGEGKDWKDVKAEADAKASVKGLEETDVPLFGATKVEAYSKDEAKELRSDMASYEGVMSMLATMEELDKQYGFEAMPNSDAKALGKAMANDFLLLKKNLEKLGVLSESDKDIIESLLRNPTSDMLRRGITLVKNQQVQSTNKIVNNLNSKTKVGDARFTDKWVLEQVSPLARKRADYTLKTVLSDFKPQQQPKEEPTSKTGWKMPEVKINK